MSSSLSFFCCFLIDFLIGYVSRYSTRMKYRCIWFPFCPPKSIIIIHHVFSQSQLISAAVGHFVGFVARYRNNIVLFSHQFYTSG